MTTPPPIIPQIQDHKQQRDRQEGTAARPAATAAATTTTNELIYKDQIRSHILERTQRQRRQEQLANKQTLSVEHHHHHRHHQQQQQSRELVDGQVDHEYYANGSSLENINSNNNQSSIPVAHAVVLTDRDRSILDIRCLITKRKCQRFVISTFIVVILTVIATISGYCASAECHPRPPLSPTPAPNHAETESPSTTASPTNFVDPSFSMTSAVPSIAPSTVPSIGPSVIETEIPSTTTSIRSYIEGIIPTTQNVNEDAIAWIDNNVITPQLIDEPYLNIYAHIRELYALISFFYSMNGTNWTNRDRWLNPASVITPATSPREGYCSWYGVGCKTIQYPGDDFNRTVVVGMNLESNQLQGQLPQDLALLYSFQYFDVSYNDITGTIPDEYRIWTNLTIFRAGWNELSGPIPDSISDWTLLRHFEIGFNELIGTIPEIFLDMNWFGAGNNTLTGTISDSVGDSWRSMSHFDVSNNMLNGNVPESLALWSYTATINLSGNHFTGTIPIVICNKSFALFESDLPPCV